MFENKTFKTREQTNRPRRKHGRFGKSKVHPSKNKSPLTASQIGSVTTFDGSKTTQMMPRPAKKNRFSQIGHNIKLVREVKFRWAVKIFAEKMEVSEHTVRDWENARTVIPHYRTVQAAKIFNMTLPELETAHQHPLVHIESQHNNQEINNIGTMHSDMEGLNEFIQELRADKAELKVQLAKRDARIEKLENQVEELLAKLGQQ